MSTERALRRAAHELRTGTPPLACKSTLPWAPPYQSHQTPHYRPPRRQEPPRGLLEKLIEGHKVREVRDRRVLRAGKIRAIGVLLSGLRRFV